MLLDESIAKSAVVKAIPFRAACENSRASMGRTPRDAVCVDTGDPHDLQLFFVDPGEDARQSLLAVR
jgi:hypothetical protein